MTNVAAATTGRGDVMTPGQPQGLTPLQQSLPDGASYGADASEAAAAPADASDGEGELDADEPRTLTMAGFGPR